jgi:chemotaxis protein MotA
LDIATLIGLLGGWGTMVAAIILGGSAGMFLNIPSLAIVCGGTFMVVMMKFSMGQFLGAVKVAVKVFSNKTSDTAGLIDELEEMAGVARKDGLLALEGRDISDDFLKKGIGMMVDGHSPEVIRSVLSKDMAQTIERHEVGQAIFKGLGDYAPAMGMIGTLIGLVQMLANMDDPKSIGPAMAVALLTTLYGAMLANLFALPIADKLELRSTEERRVKALILDGLQSIQAGHNPHVIKALLSTYLPASKRSTEDKG